MMYYSLYHIFLSAIVGPALHNVVDACGRTPARTQPRPTTTPTPTRKPGGHGGGVIPPPSGHRQGCTEEEDKKVACLNGGSCYAVNLDGRSAYCHCPRMYKGNRCEQLSSDIFVLYAGEVKKAGIAVGVVVGIIIITIIVVYFAIKRRKRRKREEERRNAELGAGQEAQLNGNPDQPLMKEHEHLAHLQQVPIDNIALNGLEKTPETNV